MMDNEVLLSLKKAKLLQGLSAEHLKIIAAHGNRIEFKPDEIIISEGQERASLYIILQGQVVVYLPKGKDGETSARPTKVLLNKLAEGDCVGEYSIIDNQPASASVAAVGTCELFELPKEDFYQLVNSDDGIAKTLYRNMLEILIKRAREYDSELDSCFVLA